MNLDGILPFLGTATLAGIAVVLGYLALTASPVTPVTAGTQTVDPVVQTFERQSRSQTLPAARPDMFYAAITERPLFAPDRRPIDRSTEPVPVVTTPPEPEDELPNITPPTDLQLSGVLGGGANRSAFVARSDGVGEWLRVDAQIDGWTITEIGPDWIILTAGEDTIRLELFQ